MRQRGLRRKLKRAADCTVAGSVLLAAAPVMAGVAAAIRATMGGPVLFTQTRIGQGDRTFKLYKFRTLTNDTDANGNPLPDAQRLTRLGELLRRSSLDELPQLFNVLKGEMSLIGPRPLLVQYLPRYSARQRRRHEVLPGMTGWAQVNGRNGLDWDAKFEHDVWYVEHWGLRLDAKVLTRTVAALLKPSGVSAEGHATMPEFMGPGDQSEAPRSTG